jgi:5-methylcytosine-specific restriction endonuclease McrBC regulatory subunit McrC
MSSRRPDDIECFEVGSGNQLPWIGSLLALGDDWPTTESLAKDGVIQIEMRDDQVAISGATRVGLIVLPSGRRLVIRSKIPSLTLLEWLAYLGEFPSLSSWLPDPGVAAQATEQDDWHRCIGRLFLYALEQVTRSHLQKDYVAVASDPPEIRGRIDTTAFARRLHRLPRVPQIQRRRTLDTPFNIVLALALDRLPVLLADGRANDHRRVARLREQWAWISRGVANPVAEVTAAQWASPPGYRAALQLARLILIGAVLDPISTMGGQAFTLPLAAIWERALRRMLGDLADETGWYPVPDGQRIRNWDDPVGRDDPKRRLMADVIAERAGARWVLDTKYKMEYRDESRLDRFQMCAYAVAFDADRVSLVYPTGSSTGHVRDLLHATIGNRTLCIDSLALPMAAGPETCRAALAAVEYFPRSSRADAPPHLDTRTIPTSQL